MHFEGKTVTGTMVIGKSKLITDRCTFFEGRRQNCKEPGPEGVTLMEYGIWNVEYSLMSCTALV